MLFAKFTGLLGVFRLANRAHFVPGFRLPFPTPRAYPGSSPACPDCLPPFAIPCKLLRRHLSQFRHAIVYAVWIGARKAVRRFAIHSFTVPFVTCPPTPWLQQQSFPARLGYSNCPGAARPLEPHRAAPFHQPCTACAYLTSRASSPACVVGAAPQSCPASGPALWSPCRVSLPPRFRGGSFASAVFAPKPCAGRCRRLVCLLLLSHISPVSASKTNI